VTARKVRGVMNFCALGVRIVLTESPRWVSFDARSALL